MRRHTLSAAALLAAAVSMPSLVFAEGNTQLGIDQRLQANNTVFVEIVDSTAEKITWTGTGSVTVTDPNGTSLGSFPSGSVIDPTFGVDGPYQLVNQSLQGSGVVWDFAATLGGLEIPGRVYSLDWDIRQPNGQATATDGSFYARVAGGLPGQDAVIELDLGGFNGIFYQIVANRFGVNGVNAGRSVPQVGNSMTPEFRLYLAPPALSSYSAVTPNLTDLSFLPDGAAIPCTLLPLGGTGGTFTFTTDVEGTYHLVCDTNQDATFNIVDGSDLFLVGPTSPGSNSIVWDGTDTGNGGTPLPAGDYNCRLEIHTGEFHFAVSDAETSFPGLRLFEVSSGGARTGLPAYWNDTLVQSLGATMFNGEISPASSPPDGLDPGAQSDPLVTHSTTTNGNTRAWGRFVNSGKGNQTFLDTFTWVKESSPVIATLTVAATADCDGDGLTDFTERCITDTEACTTDTDGDGTDDAAESGGLNVDTDNDGDVDGRDLDSDADGVCDGAAAAAGICTAGPDVARTNSALCIDRDADLCDDCSSGSEDAANDGTDSDVDGLCDTGDPDDDNDTVCDGAAAVAGVCTAGPDSNRTDPNLCQDADSDLCDDCSNGSPPNPATDGVDSEGDGQCDTGDPDDDNDGVCDGAAEVAGVCRAGPDGERTNATACLDTDGDTCDDCTGGSFDVANDGSDNEGDGLCDLGDPDDDNDGICDGAAAVGGTCGAGPDTSPTDASVCQDSDNDTCEDCVSGAFDPSNDGTDTDGDGVCNAGEDTDGDGVRDPADLDDDNDGVPDALENDHAVDPNGDADGDDIENFIDATDRGDGEASSCTDSEPDGICDSFDSDYDRDGDGVPNHLDLDADNDGIPDVIEAGHDGVDADATGLLDCDGGVGTNGLCDDLETAADSGIADYNSDASGPDDELDTDADGTPDFLDLDSDADGIPDAVEGGSGCTDSAPADGRCDGSDVDGDGIVDDLDDAVGFQDDGYSAPRDTNADGTADYRSLDADGDSISDLVEGASGCEDSAPLDGQCDGPDTDDDGLADDAAATTPDGDEDAKPDFRDIDADDDGILDEVEGTGDVDGDTIPNYLDLDSDNDGILDVVEGGSGCADNTPQDGRCDGSDEDGDGRADDATQDTTPDTDGDGPPDYLDLDSDNDGAPDLVEGDSGCADVSPANAVCDGPDADGDGLADDAAFQSPPDTDSDTSPDFRDIDTDNDGLIDSVEVGSGCTDIERNGLCDGPDSDGDGIVDSIDEGEGFGDTTPTDPANNDEDADDDFRDLDSDDDGVFDIADSRCEDVAPADNRCDGPDTDGDGAVDAIDGLDQLGILQDADGDGIGDPLDLDDDNDGIPDEGEGELDTDGDGVADSFDLDSDNDGIPDVVEAGHDEADADGDGTVDCASGVGENGFCDDLETIADNGQQSYGIVDTDDDTIPDFQDLDSDNDAISDRAEGSSRCTDTTPANGVCDGADDDGDGVVDSADEDDGFGFGGYATAPDTDEDGTPDFRDLESDGDGIPDLVEAGEGARDTDGDGRVDGDDTDGDGIRDTVDDSDSDGTPDSDDSDVASYGGGGAGIDTDEDGAFDYRDTDSDDDGLDDTLEAGDTPANPVDTDEDGTPDFQSTDSDGDGVRDDTDNCRVDANADQLDEDEDDAGRACDRDDNGDGFDDDLGIQGGCSTAGSTGVGSGLGLFTFAIFVLLVAARRRWRSTALLLAVASLSLAALGPPAHAQTSIPTQFPVERFRLSSDRDGLLDVEWGGVPGHMALDVALWIGYADDPLNLYRRSTSGDRDRVASLVSGRLGGGLVASFSLWSRVQLGFELPVILHQTADVASLTNQPAELSGFGLGNLRFVPKVGLLMQKDHGIDLAVIAGFTVPTTTHDDYSGDDHLTFAPEIAISHAFEMGLRLAANIGYRLREKVTVIDLVVDDEIFAHAGLGYRFSAIGGPPLELFATVGTATAVTDFFTAFNRDHAELKFGAAYDIAGTAKLFAAAGVGVASGYGTPDWRALGGIRFYYGGKEEPKAPADTDNDGLIDSEDRCPTEPETRNDFEDDDGCPDTVPTDGDGDRDGLKDSEDRCPNTAEDADGFEDGDGCPDLDNDSDGVLDVDDKCPNEAGERSNEGCPDPDRDGDGVVDRIDNCPDEAGKAEFQGCNEKQLVKIVGKRLEILDVVYFRTARADIRAKSYPVLDNVAQVISSHPELKAIRVAGHTDARGSHESNQRLSERRAQSVVRYLVRRGVDASRLEAVGYGESRPIVDNTTRQGRAANRRVEFKIVDASGEGIETQRTGPTGDTMD